MDLQLTGTVAIVTGGQPRARPGRGPGPSPARAPRVVAAAPLGGRPGGPGGGLRRADPPGALRHARRHGGRRPSPGVALERFGRLDCVVNNAGIAPAGRFLDQDLDVLAEVVAVNVTRAGGPVAGPRPATSWTPAGGGSIINVGSTSSLKGKPLLAAYSASKGALARLTEGVGRRVGPLRHQGEHDRPRGLSPPRPRRRCWPTRRCSPPASARSPCAAWAEPAELGPLVCYLASPAGGVL